MMACGVGTRAGVGVPVGEADCGVDRIRVVVVGLDGVVAVVAESRDDGRSTVSISLNTRTALVTYGVRRTRWGGWRNKRSQGGSR